MSVTSPLASSRRNTELGLILMAGLITGSAYTLSALGRDSNIPANLVGFVLFVMGLLVTAHIATRYLARGADGVLLPLAALLNGIGYVMIARLDAKNLAGLQATWTMVGIAAYIGTLVVVRHVNDLRRYQWTFLFIGVGLLMMPLVPGITTSRAIVRRTLEEIAQTGVRLAGSGVTHLEEGVRQHFFAFLEREYPDLLDGYRGLYQGSYAPKGYVQKIKAMVSGLIREVGTRTKTR